MSAERVIVVVVNWNGAEFLQSCLDSVAAQETDFGVTTVVIDNGSTDQSLDFLAEHYPHITVIRSERNNYAAANNLGVSRARGDYALLLNTDATLQPGCLATLVETLDRDHKAASAAPKVLSLDGTIWTTGIHQRDDLYWVDRDHGEVDDDTSETPEEVLGVSGCCALFRVSPWRKVGGQDADLHMYYEDVELALKLRAAGYRSLYVPAASCVHEGHGSISKSGVSKDQLGERNRLLILARHFRDRFAEETVRSPWFQSAAPKDLRQFLPKLAVARGKTSDDSLLDLMLVLRDEVRAAAGEMDQRWGDHRNLPKILEEREEWIATLLEEVSRLRIWRLPGKRLKEGEAQFLARMRGHAEPPPDAPVEPDAPDAADGSNEPDPPVEPVEPNPSDAPVEKE